jgi:hypothetical protein
MFTTKGGHRGAWGWANKAGPVGLEEDWRGGLGFEPALRKLPRKMMIYCKMYIFY